MSARAVVVALSILAGACSPTGEEAPAPPAKTFALAPDACVSEHLLALTYGGGFWSDYGLSFELRADGIPVVCKSASEMPSIGVTFPGRMVAFEDVFMRDAPTNYIVAAFAHELGHLGGLQHVSDPSAVMYPNANGAPALTQADVAEVERVRASW